MRSRGGALFAFFFVAVVGRLVMAFGDYNEVAEFAFVLLQFFLREDFDVEFVFVVVNESHRELCFFVFEPQHEVHELAYPHYRRRCDDQSQPVFPTEWHYVEHFSAEGDNQYLSDDDYRGS